MKKFFAAVLCLLLLVGCGDAQPAESSEENMETTGQETEENATEEASLDWKIRMTPEEKAEGWRIYPESGVKYFARKDYWRERRGYLYKVNENFTGKEDSPVYSQLTLHFITPEQNEAINDVYVQDLTPEEEQAELEPILAETKPLFGVFVFRKDVLDDSKDLDAVTGFSEQEVLYDKDNLMTVWCTAPEDTENLDESMKEIYLDFYEDVAKIRASIVVDKPLSLGEVLDMMELAKMNTVDLEGNDVVLGDVFQDNKLTMVNIWATFCGPCQREMPHIATVEKDYRDQGFGVLGIVGDTEAETDENIEEAHTLLNESGAEFFNVKRSADMDRIIERISGFPTTFFVNQDGRIVGKAHLGSMTEEQFRTLIEEYLSEVQ